MQSGSCLHGHLCCSVSIVLLVVCCLLFGCCCCDAKLITDDLYPPPSALDIDSPSSADEPVLVQKYSEADLEQQPGFYVVKGRPEPSPYYGFSSHHKRWQPTGIDLKDAYRKMATAIAQHRKTLRSQNSEETNRQRRWDNGVLYPDLRTRLTAE